MKIYGPYLRKDGRKHIVIVNDDKSKTTKSYPRYLMENFLGRKLQDFETVDHINDDKTDDRIENLQLLSRVENSKKLMKLKPRKLFSFVCPNCNKESTKFLNNVLANKNKYKSGPYCSRKCAGQATYKNPWKNKDKP